MHEPVYDPGTMQAIPALTRCGTCGLVYNYTHPELDDPSVDRWFCPLCEARALRRALAAR